MPTSQAQSALEPHHPLPIIAPFSSLHTSLGSKINHTTKPSIRPPLYHSSSPPALPIWPGFFFNPLPFCLSLLLFPSCNTPSSFAFSYHLSAALRDLHPPFFPLFLHLFIFDTARTNILIEPIIQTRRSLSICSQRRIELSIITGTRKLIAVKE